MNSRFVLAFENDKQITSAKDYYLPNVEIKDYSFMINETNFFDQPIKDNKVAYENIRNIDTGQGDDYTTGCLLDYPYVNDTCCCRFEQTASIRQRRQGKPANQFHSKSR